MRVDHTFSPVYLIPTFCNGIIRNCYVNEVGDVQFMLFPLQVTRLRRVFISFSFIAVVNDFTSSRFLVLFEN